MKTFLAISYSVILTHRLWQAVEIEVRVKLLDPFVDFVAGL